MFQPFKKFKDILRVYLLTKLLPKRIPNRCEMLKKLIDDDSVSVCDLDVFSQKMEDILPAMGDNTTDFDSSLKSMEVPSHIIDCMIKSDIPIRHLLPPVEKCCGELLKITLSSRCIVFETTQALPGALYSGLCKKCKQVYHYSHYKDTNSTLFYYQDQDQHLYFASTKETVFEKKLLLSFDRNMWVLKFIDIR